MSREEMEKAVGELLDVVLELLDDPEVQEYFKEAFGRKAPIVITAIKIIVKFIKAAL